MDGLELISFQIISTVGTARSLFVEAIQEAKAGRFEEARKMIKEGQEVFDQGHHAHAQLIQQEAADDQEPVEINLLLMHAEDQLMAADSFKIVAEEFIELYERIQCK